MFPQKMLVEQSLGNRLCRGIDLESFPSHFRNDFQGQGVFHSLGARGSPGKRSVPGDQDCADLLRIEVLKALDNDIPGFPFVGALDFRWSHWAGNRNLAIEVISMRRPKAGNGLPRLRKGNGVARMSVHDRADRPENA